MRRVLLALCCAGCAGAPVHTRRTRPTGVVVHAALEAVTPLAQRCLQPGDRVTVDGFFDGPTGWYRVERVGTASDHTRVAVQQCVAMEMESARVRPFTADRRDATWTVAVPQVSAAVRAMLRGDAGASVETALMGDIDSRAVLAIVRGEHAETQRCYEDALRGTPGLRGTLELRFTISVDGRITHAVASGPPGFGAVGHCILGRLRTLAWPMARTASVDFVTTLHFAPRR